MTLPPIRRQVVVPAGPPTAFAVFTERIGSWWPLKELSVYGKGSTAAFRAGRLVETGPDGTETEWGSVLDWSPPHRLRITWHPGHAATAPADSAVSAASEVEVTFAPVGEGQTLVTVTHRGWESYPDPGAARTEYGSGWPGVLRDYGAAVPAGGEPGAGPVWLVLRHCPAPGITNPFAEPGFAGHPAFLGTLAERGLLLAAGAFAGGGGEGMTIVRLPDAADAAELVRAAYEDDASVTGGVLEAEVRPWLVALTGGPLA